MFQKKSEPISASFKGVLQMVRKNIKAQLNIQPKNKLLDILFIKFFINLL